MEIETRHVVIGIFLAVVFMIVSSFVSINNRAIGYEEQIENQLSNINIQEQRQKSIILQLVQVVEQSSYYEGSLLSDIAKVRSDVQNGDLSNASFNLYAVSENYPQLQAVDTYKMLMTEMSVSENLIAQHRATYNDNVKDYNNFVRKFPAVMVLNISGYHRQDFKYIEFDNTALPENLFDN